LRDLKNLPAKVGRRIIGVLLRIRNNPWKYSRRLTGTDFYRVRVGDYRIIIEIEKKIYVLRIAHRKRIYRYFK
jgi:mRNA interferase RelE/StbE